MIGGMKKLPHLVLLALITVSGAAAQIHAPKGLDVSYDKFKDKTVVYFRDSSYDSADLYAAFVVSGQTVDADINDFYFQFSKDDCHGFCFKGDVEFTVIIDGGKPWKVAEKGNVLTDKLGFMLSRDDLVRLAAADKQIEYQVGRFEGVWKQKIIEKFKGLLTAGTASQK